MHRTFPKTSHHQHFQHCHPNGTQQDKPQGNNIPQVPQEDWIQPKLAPHLMNAFVLQFRESFLPSFSLTLLPPLPPRLWGSRFMSPLWTDSSLHFLRGRWGGSNTKNTWSHSITLEHLNRNPLKSEISQEHNPWHNRTLYINLARRANIYQHPNTWPYGTWCTSYSNSKPIKKMNRFSPFACHRFYNYEIRIEQHKPHGTKSPLTKSIPEAYIENLSSYSPTGHYNALMQILKTTFLAFLWHDTMLPSMSPREITNRLEPTAQTLRYQNKAYKNQFIKSHRGIWSTSLAAPKLLTSTILHCNSGSITEQSCRIPLCHVTVQEVSPKQG